MSTETSPISILRIREVIARTGLPRSTLYGLIAEGKFPQPIKINIRAVGWRSDEIDEWVSQRIRESRGQAA